jgi:hypothetical protein
MKLHIATRIQWVRTAFILGLSFAIAACTAVEPWERGNLAKPQMAVEPHPSHRAVLEHIYPSREAAFGRNSAKGGGCGCY